MVKHLVQDIIGLHKVINVMKIQLSLDYFDTGFSSLASLKRFLIDLLKSRLILHLQLQQRSRGCLHFS